MRLSFISDAYHDAPPPEHEFEGVLHSRDWDGTSDIVLWFKPAVTMAEILEHSGAADVAGILGPRDKVTLSMEELRLLITVAHARGEDVSIEEILIATQYEHDLDGHDEDLPLEEVKDTRTKRRTFMRQ